MSRPQDISAPLLQDPKIKKQWQSVFANEAKILLKQLQSNSITIEDKAMNFKYFTKGQRPQGGYILIIGLHAGNNQEALNNTLWTNHQHLYDSSLPNGSIWFTPRALQDSEDMWSQIYLIPYFKQIINAFIFNGIVNPNKIFFTGYSTGGNGVYKLAPIMPDLFAGAATMAGHPHDVSIINIRNMPLSIHVGGLDTVEDRAKINRQYIDTMVKLLQKYKGFRPQFTCVHESCGHFMNSQQTIVFPQFFAVTRNPYPDLILFKQHQNVPNNHLYYVKVNGEQHSKLLKVRKQGNTFYIESEAMKVTICVNRNMIDFNNEVTIYHNNEKKITRLPQFNIDVVKMSMEERQDPYYIFQDQFQTQTDTDIAPDDQFQSTNTASYLSPIFKEPKIRKQWDNQIGPEKQSLNKIVNDSTLTIEGRTLKFAYFLHGEKPQGGWTLVFAMHGGGGTDAQSNEQQWNNHLHLYDRKMPPGVVWFVPRSCEDAWDMWWKPYLLDFYKTLIKGFVFNGHVNPNKIFISGYSAGGDGVYHLAPMMADWLAGAAMMAGHPNNAELQNTRNIAFSIQVGADDSGYQRNEQATTYIAKMTELNKRYGGFKLNYNFIHQACGHWMDLRDARVFPDLFDETRNPYPDFILFKQAERARQTSFYYIGVNPDQHKKLITVKKNGNEFYIESDPIKVTLYVNRLMVDFKKEVVIFHNSKKIFSRLPKLKMDVVSSSIKQRQDPFYIFEDSFVCHPDANPEIEVRESKNPEQDKSKQKNRQAEQEEQAQAEVGQQENAEGQENVDGEQQQGQDQEQYEQQEGQPQQQQENPVEEIVEVHKNNSKGQTQQAPVKRRSEPPRRANPPQKSALSLQSKPQKIQSQPPNSQDTQQQPILGKEQSKQANKVGEVEVEACCQMY